MPPRRAASAVVLLAVAATSLLVAPPASAGGLPPMHLSKATVTPGESFTVSGTGCVSPDPVSEPALVFVSGPGSDQLSPDRNGNWSATMQAGGDMFNGSYQITASCGYRGQPGYPVDYPPVTFTLVGGHTPDECVPVPGRICGPLPPPTPANRVGVAKTKAPAVTSAPPRPTSASPSPTPSPTPTPTGPLPATAARGCSVCSKLAAGEPLAAGDTVTLRYTGFQPGELVTLDMHSTPVRLGTFTADTSGVVTAWVRIPASAPAGSHTLVFAGPTTGERNVSFSVTAAVPVVQARPARSGSTTGIVLGAIGAVVVLVLLVAGGLVVYRRRQTRALPMGADS